MSMNRGGVPSGGDHRDEIEYEGYEGADLYEDDEDEDYPQDQVQQVRMGERQEPTTPLGQRVRATATSAQPVTVLAQGLRKDFMSGGEVVRAVDDVSFALSINQFVAITGPSGCGKSTLLYMLGSI